MGLFDRFREKVKESEQTGLVPGVGRMPYPAYRGKEPYIFVSYAHKDSDRVFAEIKRFNEAGFNVWYDEGISPGNEWTDEIADALAGCSLFVVMITPTSAPRENVQNEINFALDEKKPFIAIHLEATELKRGLKLQIGTKQAILKYNMSEEEYTYKYIEAFTRMGLKRNERVQAPNEGVRVSNEREPIFKESTQNTGMPEVSKAAKPERSNAAESGTQAKGDHPWGDYVPKGKAVITTIDGKEIYAIANSLILKAAGIEKRKSTWDQLYYGLDNPSENPDYAAENVIPFSDMISVEKNAEGLLVKECYGDETQIRLLSGEELWFIGEEDNAEPSSVALNEVEKIVFERESAPETKVKYCNIKMAAGSFIAPVSYLWFSINENTGVPPRMKLKKELTRFVGSNMPLKRIKKLIVTRNAVPSGPFDGPKPMDVRIELFNGENMSFVMDGYYMIYAMASGGRIHTLARTDLKEIEML